MGSCLMAATHYFRSSVDVRSTISFHFHKMEKKKGKRRLYIDLASLRVSILLSIWENRFLSSLPRHRCLEIVNATHTRRNSVWNVVNTNMFQLPSWKLCAISVSKFDSIALHAPEYRQRQFKCKMEKRKRKKKTECDVKIQQPICFHMWHRIGMHTCECVWHTISIKLTYRTINKMKRKKIYGKSIDEWSKQAAPATTTTATTNIQRYEDSRMSMRIVWKFFVRVTIFASFLSAGAVFRFTYHCSIGVLKKGSSSSGRRCHHHQHRRRRQANRQYATGGSFLRLYFLRFSPHSFRFLLMPRMLRTLFCSSVFAHCTGPFGSVVVCFFFACMTISLEAQK